jgi:hypothetical protein
MSIPITIARHVGTRDVGGDVCTINGSKTVLKEGGKLGVAKYDI